MPVGKFNGLRELLRHRGPDDAGTWQAEDKSVALGSRRLAVLDLSPHAHQPMLNATGSLSIVHNGEIYNYLELRNELRQMGHFFRSQSDTEVLLAAYEAWGPDCLERLNGMFAFAIWDEKRQELFAARDRFGEKPFYYFLDPGHRFFLFASEIKALLASGLISPKQNYAAIYRYLAHHEIDMGAETLFEGILSLPAAHALIYSQAQGKLKLWRYWDLDPEVEIRLPNDTSYAERFLELLTDAVRIRLRSDVILGSSLSGGLDSSTIVSILARELKGGNHKTFSARFHNPRYDEGHYIQRVLEWTGVEGHMIYPDPGSLLEEMNALTWHQEQPFFSTSIYAQWNVMRLAKEQGVTVLLDGQGGDEILGGYHFYFGPYFRDILLRLRWMALIKTLFKYAREHGSASLPVIAFAFLPKRLRQPLRKLVRPLAIAPELAQAVGEDLESSLLHTHNFKSSLQEALYESLTQTVLPALLRYADRNSMAFSREVRLPFLDHHLVEYLFAIPSDQKTRGTITKVVLRNAMRGRMPEEIRLRKDKLGFATPESLWLRGPLRIWIDEILHSRRFCQRGWLDPKVVNHVWQGFLAGRDQWHSLIWRWISLEIWAQVYLDQGCKVSGQQR